VVISQVLTDSGGRGKVRLREVIMELLASLEWRGARAICGRMGYVKAAARTEVAEGERSVFVVREDR
jgi:hypothetical protein